MGIHATVVQDGSTRRVVVLRSRTSSPAAQHGLVDTIASFSAHVASLQGVTRSPVEVSARWGGPPYIAYTMVAKRFRVIVVWGDLPGELDVAQDVHECVIALRAAVVAHTDGLLKDDARALAAVYDAAGAALFGGSPPPPPSPRSVASPASAPAATGKRGFRKLFSRAGGSGGGGGAPARRKQSAAAAAATKQLQPPPEGSVLGAPGASGFDDAPSALELPPAVFDWADFGPPIPPTGGDIAWIAELLRGDVARKSAARPRLLDASPGKPLGAASAASPPALSGPSLPDPAVSAPIVSPEGATVTPPRQAAQGSPRASSPSAPAQAQAHPPEPAMPAAGPPGVAVPVQMSAAIPMPMPMSPAAMQAAVPLPMSPPAQPAVPAVMTPPSQPAMVAPAQAAMPAIAPGVSPGAMPGSMPGSVSGAMPGAMPAAMPAAVASTTAGAMHGGAIHGGAMLRARSGALPGVAGAATDDFDVNALGSYKDDATVAAVSPGAGSGGAGDPIRQMMNEFAKSMQAGNFQLALSQVSATLRALSQSPAPRARETGACAHYYIAQKILLRVQVLDKQMAAAAAGGAAGGGAGQAAVQAAVLTMFLAELKNLLPRHRLAAMRMALDKNLAVGNFGMAARWIRQIADKAPPQQRAQLTTKLQVCAQSGEANQHMPPTNKLCYNLLTVLVGPHGRCSVCPAVYRPGLSGVNIGQTCPTCFTGTINVTQ